jgi:hypothetical protein
MFTVKSLVAAKPGRHRIEPHLYLEVSKDGTSRRFLFRFTSPATFKVTEAGLGVFPVVTLAVARAKAADMRAAVAKGTDPIQAKREARAATLAAQKAVATFGDTLAAYEHAFKGKGKTAERVAVLERHVPALLKRPIADITKHEVLAATTLLRARLPKTAARVYAALSAVFDYSLAADIHLGGNPASRAVLKPLGVRPPPPDVPYRMMPAAQVPAFFARLGEAPSASHLCLQWLILTCARSQEAIRVEWADIDLGARAVDDTAAQDQDAPGPPGATGDPSYRRASTGPHPIQR